MHRILVREQKVNKYGQIVIRVFFCEAIYLSVRCGGWFLCVKAPATFLTRHIQDFEFKHK